MELAEGRIVISHGDGLLFDGSPWKREILVNGKRVTELWDQHPQASKDVEERLRVARKIARELCCEESPIGKSF